MAEASRRTQGINAWWKQIPPPQRRSYLAILAGLCAFLTCVGFFPPAQDSWLAAFSRPIGILLGWGAPLALLGIMLVCGSIICDALAEKQRTNRRGIICAALALLLLLSESRLVLGDPFGGLAGAFGAWLLSHLAPFAGQLVIWGGLALDLLTFWRGIRRKMRQAASPSSPPASKQELPLRRSGRAHATPALPPTRTTPPLLDFTDEALMDELRVPAYLRRRVMLPPALPTLPELPTVPDRGFALPPLPRAKGKRRTGVPAAKR